MIPDYTYLPDEAGPESWDECDIVIVEPTWCGGCGSPEDPCDCYTRAFTAVDELGVPFKAPEGAIWASMSAALLDIQHLDR